jgi:hypothetical protein
MHKLRLFLTFTFSLVFLIVSLQADEAAVIQIEEWLELGPFKQNLPAFHDQKNIKGNPIKLTDLLEFSTDEIINLKPVAGKVQSAQKWNLVTTGKEGKISLKTDQGKPSIQYLGAYINVNRWIESELKVSGAHPFQVFLDGILLDSKLGSESVNDDNGKYL